MSFFFFFTHNADVSSWDLLNSQGFNSVNVEENITVKLVLLFYVVLSFSKMQFYIISQQLKELWMAFHFSHD